MAVSLLGQQYTDDAHMWGRIMNIDVSTYKDENGKTLMYASPSNLSPASEEYKALVAERVEKLRKQTRRWMKPQFPLILSLVPAADLIRISLPLLPSIRRPELQKLII